MRLLKTVPFPSGQHVGLRLEEYFGDEIPPYAILSHTWDKDEVLFADVQTGNYASKAGYNKLKFAFEQARIDGYGFIWIDTCCIDKASSAELSEAINSMYTWYRQAAKCYAYLADVSIVPEWGEIERVFRESR